MDHGSFVSPLCLPHEFLLSPLCLPCVSLMSPLCLPHVSLMSHVYCTACVLVKMSLKCYKLCNNLSILTSSKLQFLSKKFEGHKLLYFVYVFIHFQPRFLRSWEFLWERKISSWLDRNAFSRWQLTIFKIDVIYSQLNKNIVTPLKQSIIFDFTQNKEALTSTNLIIFAAGIEPGF